MFTKSTLASIIEKLSIQEKRYITKNLKCNKEEGKMLSLFHHEQICLEKEMSGDDKVSEKYNNMLRNKLFDKILSNLGDYYDETIIEYKILEEFKKIFSLYHKGLYKLCIKKLKNLEKNVEYWGFYEFFSLIFHFYFLLQNKNVNIVDIEEVERLMQKMELNLQLDKEIKTLYALVFELNYIRHNYGVNHPKLVDFFNKVKTFEKENYFQLIHTKSFRYNYFVGLLRVFEYTYIHKDYENALIILKSILNKFYEIFQSKQFYSLELNRYFLSCLYNYLTLLIYTHKNDAITNEFSRLQTLKSTNFSDEYTGFLIHALKFDFYLQNFTNYKSLLRNQIYDFKEIFQEYINKKMLKTEEIMIYKSRLAWAFFLLKDYKLSFHFINDLTFTSLVIREDLEFSIRLLEVLYYYEIKAFNFSYKLKRFLQKYFTRPITLKIAIRFLTNLLKKIKNVRDISDLDRILERIERILQHKYNFTVKIFEKKYISLWWIDRKSS